MTESFDVFAADKAAKILSLCGHTLCTGETAAVALNLAMCVLRFFHSLSLSRKKCLCYKSTPPTFNSDFELEQHLSGDNGSSLTDVTSKRQ